MCTTDVHDVRPVPVGAPAGVVTMEGDVVVVGAGIVVAAVVTGVAAVVTVAVVAPSRDGSPEGTLVTVVPAASVFPLDPPVPHAASRSAATRTAAPSTPADARRVLGDVRTGGLYRRPLRPFRHPRAAGPCWSAQEVVQCACQGGETAWCC